MDIVYRTFSVSQHSTDIIDIALVRNEPSFSIFNMNPSKLYSIIMIDPDAPTGFDGNKNGNKNKNKTFLHWWIANIKGNTQKILNYDTFMPYSPPSPSQGKHRYFFKLFSQPSNISNPQIMDRTPYNIDKWISTYHLEPIGELVYIVDSLK